MPIVGKKPDTPLRKMQIDELKNFKRIDALVFHSPVDEKEIGIAIVFGRFRKIPGIQWIDTPGHTEKILLLMEKNVALKKR